MFPISGTFPVATRSYWDLDTIVMQKIISRHIVVSLITKIILSKKTSHVKPLVEVSVDVAREANEIMTVASESTKIKNLMEGIMTKTKISLETVFKRW